MSVHIISRADWHARQPKTTPVKVARDMRREFIVHFSGAAANQSVRAIQDWCMDGRGFNDIDYNLLVRGTTGEAYMGRGWDILGAHTVGHNTSGVAVCVISDGPISDAAKRTVRALYDQACDHFGRRLTKTMHRLLDQTNCPGDIIARWVSAGMPAPEGDDDVQVDELLGADKIINDINPGKAGAPDANPTMSVGWAMRYATHAHLALEEVRALRTEVAALTKAVAALTPKPAADR